jgi:methylphosphotriester-DNA--protein-cysteine methyltransferase
VTSPRTLTRRLHTVIGESPFAYFQVLRVERAVHLLQTSHHSVDRIADEVGSKNILSPCKERARYPTLGCAVNGLLLLSSIIAAGY